MKLSVIIPFYNGNETIKQTIRSCVKSIQVAGLGENSEIIIINDSPNTTVKIDPLDYQNINVYNNPQNMGIHGSRVKGILKSKGEFVHLIDQDDSIAANFYKSQFKLSSDADIVVCNAELEHPNYKRKLYRSSLSLKIVKHGIAYIYLGNRIESPGQCLILKRSIPAKWMTHILNVNGADDMLLWLMMFIENKNFCANSDILYVHHYTENNLSLDEDNMIRSCEETLDILRKNYGTNKIVKRFSHYVDFYKHKQNKKYGIDDGKRKFSLDYGILYVIELLRIFSRKIRG